MWKDMRQNSFRNDDFFRKLQEVHIIIPKVLPSLNDFATEEICLEQWTTLILEK